MAIESVAAVAAAKELAAKAAIEAAKQIAQKMAGEVASKGVETQALDFERQSAQEGFRVGEMNQPGHEELIMSRAGEEQACNELAQKLTDTSGDASETELDDTTAEDSVGIEERQDVVGTETQEQPDEVEVTQETPISEVEGEMSSEDLSHPGEDKISYEVHTRNESLEGDRHPVTGVPFERKTVTDAEGNEVIGVFPVFESTMDAQLPGELCKGSDREQFDECNRQLKDAVGKDSELASKFTPDQLEQINNGDTPDGYTWHHNEEKGKMQLVDSDVHAQTGHTGGKSIWGGGSEFR